MMKKPVDYLILSPLQEEINALLHAFGTASVETLCYPDGTPYWSLRIERTGSARPVMVHIAQLKDPGVLLAAVSTSRLLEECRPACVVSFGIAGGFIKKNGQPDVKLGDVVVADKPVVYYEPAKEEKSARHSRMITIPVDDALASQLVAISGRRAKGYRLRHGQIASGEKVINDIKGPARKAIRSLNDKMLAVETEAAGVAAAAREAESAGNPSRVLILKGISDDAENKRDNQPSRQQSVRRAADLLAYFIREFELEHDEHPKDLRADKIREKTKALCELLAPWVYEPIDPNLAARVFNPLDDPPPLFYRWDLLHRQMHWVDFHFLLIIKRMTSLGLNIPVHLLVSDPEKGFGNEGRDNTKKIIEAVLPGAKVHWQSETLDLRGTIGTYAQKQGFGGSTVEQIRRAKEKYAKEKVQRPIPEQYEDPESFSTAEDWLQYIGWEARYQDRCIYLYWHPHAETMETLLLNFLELTPLVISTPDLRLGDTLGKFEPPGENLLIDPPRFESILSWLEKETSDKEVADLAKHFAVLDPAAVPDEEVSKIVAGREKLEMRLKGDDAFAEAARKIVHIIAYWNHAFFGKL
jgi:adenosylhomocysteine nucleosidase